MFKINSDNSIEMTRSDTPTFTVNLTDYDGNEYVMDPLDELVFTVKKDYYNKKPLIQVKVQGSNVIHLKTEDTICLKYGTYKYDVQLNTKDGQIFTVIPYNNFTLNYEVTLYE